MSDSVPSQESATDAVMPASLWIGRVLCHIRKPENLVTYLVFTAWMKFMGVSENIPSITVG